MLFMEDIFVLCEHCEGKRFKPEILEIQYKGKNIYNVLQTTVAEARKFFAGTHRLSRGLKVLDKVGLGYLRLGQPATTLSGGESQRLKIARELLSTDNTNVIYILDEPTTGLHFRDVKVLIRVMQELVERGSTVVVVEHNVDVMKSADWVIDFGPEGGDKGGKIVVQGSPEKVATSKKSLTAPYLAAALEKAPELSLQDYLVSEAGAETAAQP